MRERKRLRPTSIAQRAPPTLRHAPAAASRTLSLSQLMSAGANAGTGRTARNAFLLEPPTPPTHFSTYFFVLIEFFFFNSFHFHNFIQYLFPNKIITSELFYLSSRVGHFLLIIFKYISQNTFLCSFTTLFKYYCSKNKY